MFSFKNNSDFDCDELVMNSYTENCWSDDQSQYDNNPQVLGTTRADKMYYGSHLVWSSDHTYEQTAPTERNLGFGVNQFCNGSTPQPNSVQYTPLTPDPVSYPVFHLPSQQLNSNAANKTHHALISFAPTRNHNFKKIVKRKRKRTVFTTEQIEALEDIFKGKQYITREERQVIVDQLHLSDKTVKIWFQNRRLKNKKGFEEDEQNTVISFEEFSPDMTRLEYVESQINEKTDQSGFVTLDDGIMKELFNVIDHCLTNNSPEDTSESDSSSPIYEPISPASASDSNDEDTSSYWKPSEPNESLQRLFDLQNIISS